jgi:hypothetical protein
MGIFVKYFFWILKFKGGGKKMASGIKYFFGSGQCQTPPAPAVV